MDFKYQLDNLRYDFCLEETEDNWEKISKAIQAFMSLAENGGYESTPTEVVNAIRNFHRPITNAMNSERTRLCGTALDLLTSLTNGLGRDFDQLLPLFLPTLLNICGRTNKVVINRARGVILNIIESTQLTSVLPFFVQNLKDKSASLRLVLSEGTLACLNSCNPPDLEKDARARDIETIIRGTARDANPDVRKVSRKIFESYKILLPSRVESFTAPLSPTMKKYLEIKAPAKAKLVGSSKSIANLREYSREPNPVAVKAPRHLRTASASTLAVNSKQPTDLASKFTRVIRKEQPIAPSLQQPVASQSVVPEKRNAVRPGHSNLKVTETLPGPVRTVAKAKLTSAPVRNHTETTSRPVPSNPASSATASRTVSTTVVAVARRMQVTSDLKAVAGASSSLTSGPRRVPLPPPPPKVEPEGQQRARSRGDTSAPTNEVAKPSFNSSTRPTVTRTKAATFASRPHITKPPVPKFRPTDSAQSTSSQTLATSTSTITKSIKPLVINKAKPVWGRAAPLKKALPPAVSKAPTKKPSRLNPSTAAAATVGSRPITPKIVPLPASPTPTETKENEKEIDEINANVANEESALQVQKTLSDNSSTTQRLEVNVITDEDTDKTLHIDTQTLVSVSPADSQLPTPTSEGSGPVMHVGGEEKCLVDNPEIFNEDRISPHTPDPNHLMTPENMTPQLSAKTPISALLSSIERGFLYSPTTPLSPADSYLPGPNGTIAYRHETHAPRVEGPMQPFNHALHVINTGGLIFGKLDDGREGDVLSSLKGVEVIGLS